MTLTTLLPQRPPVTAKKPVPYLTLFGIVLAAGMLAGVAYFSLMAAAILYVPLYLLLCYFRPGIALWIMFAAVSFPYNVTGTEAIHMAPAEISLCLAFPVFWLRAYAARRPRVSNPLLMPIVLYFAVCIFSSLVHWAGRDAAVSIVQMFIYLIVAVKFFSTCVIETEELYVALYGLIASCTFVSLCLLVGRTNDVLSVHKNATGTFLSYSVIILAELWLAAVTRGARRRWLVTLLLVNVAGLVMSTSRGAWMGTAAGLTCLLICRRQYGLFAKALLLCIPAIAICWCIVPQEQRDYATDVSAETRDFKSRLTTIDVYKHQFMQSPVIGMGIGLRKEVDSTNIIMSTLAETGVVGLAAFLGIQLALLWTTYRGSRLAPRDHPDMTFLALGMGLAMCLLTHGCVDHYWSRSQLPVWGMAGAAIAVRSAQRAMLAQRRPKLPRIAPIR